MEQEQRTLVPPPGLVALVVYLRPAARGHLLGQLSGLGFFVVEHQGIDGAVDVATATCADVALVFATGDDTHVRLVVELARKASRAVIVGLPTGADLSPFADTDVMRCLPDEELATSFVAILTAAAARARKLRGSGDITGSVLSFGDIAFDPRLPALSREGRSRVLSRSERAVLLRLASTAGRPVDGHDLERAATPPGATIHAGFLKAIILRLRRKISDIGGDPELLQTVRGFGYVLARDGA